MRTAVGATLLTVGCLMGLGVIHFTASAAEWLPDQSPRPGGGGLSALLAIAFAGWAGLALVLGGWTLRGRAAGRWPVVTAAVAGALAGFAVYFLYELRRPWPDGLGPGEERVEVRVRAFGTIFSVPGGTRVSWQLPNGHRRGSWSEGAEAKEIMWVCAVALVYTAAGGLAGGGLAALFRRQPLPVEAADYYDRLAPPGGPGAAAEPPPHTGPRRH